MRRVDPFCSRGHDLLPALGQLVSHIRKDRQPRSGTQIPIVHCHVADEGFPGIQDDADVSLRVAGRMDHFSRNAIIR